MVFLKGLGKFKDSRFIKGYSLQVHSQYLSDFQKLGDGYHYLVLIASIQGDLADLFWRQNIGLDVLLSDAE